MAIKCGNKECANAQSTDDNNFRGVQRYADPKWTKPLGAERFYCYACGAEGSREEVKEADAILPAAPSRQLKQGDATNLPDGNEQKEG